MQSFRKLFPLGDLLRLRRPLHRHTIFPDELKGNGKDEDCVNNRATHLQIRWAGGMNVERVNMWHTARQWHQEVIYRVKRKASPLLAYILRIGVWFEKVIWCFLAFLPSSVPYFSINDVKVLYEILKCIDPDVEYKQKLTNSKTFALHLSNLWKEN
jgi:hypothetical protein